jgi:predicted DNA-binding ribbon-helix-helix protein
MTNTPISHDEIATRNETARDILAGFATAAPSLSDFWRYLETALADTVVLSAEVSRLSAELDTERLDTANLLAAMRATLAAYADGEADPLWYLRDELNAHQARSQSHGRVS